MKTFAGSFLVISFFIIGFASVSSSQTDEKVSKENLNTFNIYFINGYALSYNYYTTEKFYLRAQLDFSTNGENIDTDGENIMEYTNSKEKQTRSDENKSDYLSVAISTQIIYPFYNSEYGQAYFGIGPKISYTNNSYKTDSDGKSYYPDTTSTPNIFSNSNKNSSTSYDVGINLLLGLKAYITDNISLFAETHFTGGRRWAETEWNYTNVYNAIDSSKNTNESDGNGWFYEATFIRLGVSVSL